MRDKGRALLQTPGRGLERRLLRDEGRVLLQTPGRGLERRLLRDEDRELLRVPGQGLYRGLGLPELSGGRESREGEVKVQNGGREVGKVEV